MHTDRQRRSSLYRFTIVILLAIATCLAAVPARAARAAGDLLWENQSNLIGNQNAVAASSGRTASVGSVPNASGGSDFVVLTYDAGTGILLWGSRVDGAGGNSGATAIVMNSRLVIVSGAVVAGQTLLRAYLAKSGGIAWETQIPVDTVRLVLDKSGLTVVGTTLDSTGNVQALVRSYSVSSGVVAWERRLPIGGLPLVVLKKGTPKGGRAFVTGIDWQPFGAAFCFVRSYDLDSGELLWESVHASLCRPIAATTDGKHVILAGQGGFGYDDYLVQAYDAGTGQFLWENRTFVSTGLANAAVAIDTEKHLAFVVGWVRWVTQISWQEAMIIRAYDAVTGTVRWEDQFPSANLCMCHGSAVLADEGQVYAIARDIYGGSTYVRAYDVRAGSLLWGDQFFFAPVGSEGVHVDEIVADGGRVFVDGSGLNPDGSPEFFIRAYNAKREGL